MTPSFVNIPLVVVLNVGLGLIYALSARNGLPPPLAIPIALTLVMLPALPWVLAVEADRQVKIALFGTTLAWAPLYIGELTDVLQSPNWLVQQLVNACLVVGCALLVLSVMWPRRAKTD